METYEVLFVCTLWHVGLTRVVPNQWTGQLEWSFKPGQCSLLYLCRLEGTAQSLLLALYLVNYIQMAYCYGHAFVRNKCMTACLARTVEFKKNNS